jgi:isocitrate/isopropylmalate dehydrogenase
MMWLTKNPEDYGVIVAGNMFGDIISDAFAGLVGGLGFACSANVGDDCRGLRAHARLARPSTRPSSRASSIRSR